jgi:CrcB protein
VTANGSRVTPSSATPLDVVLVFAGGAIGTAVRYALTVACTSAGGLPVIFAINITGAFLLGMLSERIKQVCSGGPSKKLSLFLGTGALGGFTTYGTFAADTEGLLDTSRFPDGIVYGLATVVIGVGAAFAGTLLVAHNAERHGAASKP